MTERLGFDLSGRTALITGAGQGVGRTIAQVFAAHGAFVGVNDYVPERAEAVAQEIQAAGGKALALGADISAPEAVDQMVRRLEDEAGGVDILVNNAGNAGPAGTNMPRLTFWETGPADWDVYFRVNLFGVMHCARACAGGMAKRGYGRIITIISDAARVGEPGHEAYSAAKAGAAGFSRALARAMGRHGVTANTISLATVRAADRTPTPEQAEMLQRALKQYIIRRPGEPGDVAAVALLLASEEGSWITGQNYPVNGGFSLAL